MRIRNINAMRLETIARAQRKEPHILNRGKVKRKDLRKGRRREEKRRKNPALRYEYVWSLPNVFHSKRREKEIEVKTYPGSVQFLSVVAWGLFLERRFKRNHSYWPINTNSKEGPRNNTCNAEDTIKNSGFIHLMWDFMACPGRF